MDFWYVLLVAGGNIDFDILDQFFGEPDWASQGIPRMQQGLGVEQQPDSHWSRPLVPWGSPQNHRWDLWMWIDESPIINPNIFGVL